MLKKVSVILLVFSFYFSVAFAEAPLTSDLSQYRYTYIADFDSRLSITSGIANCFGTGRGRYDNTSTVLRITLQKRDAGSSTWQYVCSWNGTTIGKSSVSLRKNRTVDAGYEYRLLTKCTILDSNGDMLETASQYSGIVSY